jgi:DNA-directed RNA polymerase specialized sigma24 family protein
MAKTKDEVGFSELHTQLRIISRLLAAQLKSSIGQQELIRILSATGASHAEIADVTGTTTGTVGVTVQRLKKKAVKASSTSVADAPLSQEDDSNV